VALAPSGLWQRFRDIRTEGKAENGDQGSAEIRFNILIAGLRMIQSHPLVGVGLGQFWYQAPVYNPELIKLNAVNIAHNTYLQLGAEAGLPTLAFFVVLMARGFVKYRAVLRLRERGGLTEIARAMRLSLIVYAVVCFFLSAWFLVAYWLILFSSQNLLEIAAFSKSGTVDTGTSGLAPTRDTGLRSQAVIDMAKQTA
jgi:O-antigen ligase